MGRPIAKKNATGRVAFIYEGDYASCSHLARDYAGLCSRAPIMLARFFGCDYAGIMPGIRGVAQTVDTVAVYSQTLFTC